MQPGADMVELKNILEDIAVEVLEGTEEVRKGELSRPQKKEVLAFALNRIRPMYITSNRGFTNTIIHYMNDPQFLADIMFQISAAIRVIKKSSAGDAASVDFDPKTPYYVLPKVYGKVISSRTFMFLDQAEISLWLDGQLLEMFNGWANPLGIQPRDEGIYSFFPRPVPAENRTGTRDFHLRVLAVQGGKIHEKFFDYEASPGFISDVHIDFFENVLQLEDLYVPF
jgi:hypothetical protein